MSQKRRQRVVHFPNLRDLQREPLDLDLVVRFAAIGAAYGTKIDGFNSSERVTIDDLAHHSLCYVDIPKHVLTQLRVGSRAASFVRVATVASVVRMVEEAQVIGVAVNWKALFEGTGSGSFKVRFIGGNDFEDAHWRLYVRARQIRETPKRFDGASPLQHLYWELKRFASEQREAFVEP